MIRSVSNRFAVRSLRRNLRRTILSVVGIAIGAAIGLVSLAWIRGEEAMIVRAAAGSGIGHLRIAPAEWERRRDPKMRLASWESDLSLARSNEAVRVATPRARVRALLGMGARSAHVEIVGVEPETEQRASRFVRTVAEGRYLRPDDVGTTVIGRALAERLDATLEDELVVTLVDDEGEMQSALLRIVGIVETGSREIDVNLCHVPLSDVTELTGHEGAAEVTVLLHDYERIEEVRRSLAARIDHGDEVLTWSQVSPELLAGLKIDQAFTNVTIAVILIVVLLGVASAQLTGVLERRKEFAVLIALGMKGRQLVRVVLAEAIALGVTGGVLALLVATPLVHYLGTEGVNFAEVIGEEGMAMGGVLMDPIFYADYGAWLVPYAFLLSLATTILASLYPAWFATRTDPASALRVDQ